MNERRGRRKLHQKLEKERMKKKFFATNKILENKEEKEAVGN